MKTKSVFPIICVNYNTENETIQFISRHKSETTPIIIVDNSAQESKKIKETEKNLHSTYYFSNKNLGYLNGLGVGLSIAIEKWPNANYYILSNVDLKFDVENLISQLSNENSDQIGILAPNIISSLNGTKQNPFMGHRPKKIYLKFLQITYSSWPLTLLYEFASKSKKYIFQKIKISKEKKTDVDKPIYAPHGSFIIISSKLAKSLNPMSWPCFLFAEEIWFAEQAIKYSLAVQYYPKIDIHHAEHAITGKASSKNKMKWHHQSISWLISQYWVKKYN